MITNIADLAPALEAMGLDKRNALDVGSVVTGIRPRGLLHVKADIRGSLRNLLEQYGLVIEFERELFRRDDQNTREGLLGEYEFTGTSSERWLEIWFKMPMALEIPGDALVANPGLHLGYPSCCVSSMIGKSSIASHYASYVSASNCDRLWHINRLAVLFSKYVLIPDFFPCSLSCCNAADFARPFGELARIAWNESDYNDAIVVAQQPILLWRNFLVSFREYSISDGTLSVDVESARKVELSTIGIGRDYADPILLRFHHLAETLLGDRIVLKAVKHGNVMFTKQIEWA